MNTLNKIGKRFLSIFIFALVICASFALLEWVWGKLCAWWFWFPAKMGSATLEWLQDHPAILMVVICNFVAAAGTVISFYCEYRDSE
jgi:pheromone shutdown protein TraB